MTDHTQLWRPSQRSRNTPSIYPTIPKPSQVSMPASLSLLSRTTPPFSMTANLPVWALLSLKMGGLYPAPQILADSGRIIFGRGPSQICHSVDNLFWRNRAIPKLTLECTGIECNQNPVPGINVYLLLLYPKWVSWRPATMKTGPDDAIRVIWAIGSFFFFFHVLWLLTTVYRFYLCYTGMGSHMEAGGNENGPKQCVLHCLGHW